MSIEKKYLLGVGAVVSLAVLAKLYLSNPKRHSQIEQAEIKEQELENEKELEELRQLQQLLFRKSSDFEIEFVESTEYFSKRCLISFFNETMDLFNGDEIVKLFSQNREGRRQIFTTITHDYETYFKFIYTLDESIKYIIERTQKDFAVFLNVDFQIITESVAYHMENEGQHFREEMLRIMSEIRETLINYLPLFKEPVSQETMERIIEFQCQLLTGEEEEIMELIKKIGISNDEEEESLPVFLSCYLEDSIFLKFGIEVEQLTIANAEFDENLRGKYEKLRALQEHITTRMIEYCEKEVFVKE